MRSCFVPNCDTLCKNMTKRMMFIPPKKQELFDVWKSVLPNRRELKPTDRICERHFSSDDIFKTFDHIINGVLHQIDRGKPKLRQTAVPYFNLPTDDDRVSDTKQATSEKHQKSKKEREVAIKPVKRSEEQAPKPRRPIIKRLIKDSRKRRTKENTRSGRNKIRERSDSIDDCSFLDDGIHSTTDDHIHQQFSVEIQTTTTGEEDVKVECVVGKMNNDRIDDAQTLDGLAYDSLDASLFDGLYEDIYEVTLPNTLWGIHRDPNRTFIVFSYFDEATCSTLKLVHVDSAMNAQIYIRGKMVKKWLTRSNLSIEYLTNLVSEVDDYRICERIDSNSKCTIVAVERNLCTVCQQK